MYSPTSTTAHGADRRPYIPPRLQTEAPGSLKAVLLEVACAPTGDSAPSAPAKSPQK